MKAILWPFKFEDMQESWRKQMIWVANALRFNNIEIKKHPKFVCNGLEFLPIYDYKIDKEVDICIYNHADASCLVGNILKSKENWFFKPTVPDEIHTTLDKLGYGPYSSITYKKPNFEDVVIDDSFQTKIYSWINKNTNKWNKSFETIDLPYENYFLILGQCAGDSVVTSHDFGNYCEKLFSIVKELNRLLPNEVILIKLHPYMDGRNATTTTYSDNFSKKLKTIAKNVVVYNGKYSVHPFIKKSKCVILANSGAGFETMMQKKPIIAWGFPEYHWVSYNLRHLADLKRAIETIPNWFNPDKQSKFLYWYLEKYCFYNQETCLHRVKELLMEK